MKSHIANLFVIAIILALMSRALSVPARGPAPTLPLAPLPRRQRDLRSAEGSLHLEAVDDLLERVEIRL